jgi:outer membrane receptor protein involved in Fe transport
VQVSYTFTDSESETPTIGDDFFGVLGVSRHMFTIVTSHWITQQLNVTFDMFAASDYSLSPFGAMGRQMVFTGPVNADIVVRYDLPLRSGSSMDLFMKVNNLFNQRPYENGFLGPGAWTTGGLRIQY